MGEIDKNMDGTMDRDELAAAMKALEEQPEDEEETASWIWEVIQKQESSDDESLMNLEEKVEMEHAMSAAKVVERTYLRGSAL